MGVCVCVCKRAGGQFGEGGVSMCVFMHECTSDCVVCCSQRRAGLCLHAFCARMKAKNCTPTASHCLKSF